MVSELKINRGRYVKDRKFYDKVQGREVQWQRKVWFMTKRVKALLMQQSLHKTLQGKSVKAVGTSNENWEEMDLKATSTIQLCLADEVCTT